MNLLIDFINKFNPMDFCFINEWKSYIDTKSCPDNIIPIINYTFENRTKQLVLNSGLKIISDWTFINNSNSLANNEELLFILQSIIDDSYYILNLDVVFIIINNVTTDYKATMKLHNIENFIPRLEFCNTIVQREWWFMITTYSSYNFNTIIIKYICINIEDSIQGSYIEIFYKQCKLEPLQIINLLVKYNIFNLLEHYIDSTYFHKILYIFTLAIKLYKQILFTPYFYKTLYKRDKLYKFLSKLMFYNFEFYKHESVFSIYTDKLVISKKPITVDELFFLTCIYKHFKHVYIQKIAHCLKSKLKNIDSDLAGKLYFNIIRQIYNTDSTLFTKLFINKVLTHSFGFHFCENLRELSYRNCLINKIKTDKLFNPF